MKLPKTYAINAPSQSDLTGEEAPVMFRIAKVVPHGIAQGQPCEEPINVPCGRTWVTGGAQMYYCCGPGEECQEDSGPYSHLNGGYTCVNRRGEIPPHPYPNPPTGPKPGSESPGSGPSTEPPTPDWLVYLLDL